MEDGEFREGVVASLQAMLIEVARIYELLSVVAKTHNSELTDNVVNGHVQGELFSAAPYLNEETVAKWSGEEEE